MAAATERIPVLVTRREKAAIAKMAKATGLSMGEVLRRGAKSLRTSSADEEKALLAMIEQMNASTEQANRAIDDLLAFVEASNRRIEAIERRPGRKVRA